MAVSNIVFYLCFIIFAIETVTSNGVLLFDQSFNDIATSLPDTAIDPSEEISANILKEMCHRQAGAEFVNRSTTASANFQKCALQIATKPAAFGLVNEGVKPMCEHFEEYKDCVIKYVSDIEVCFAENEKWAPPLLQNLTATIVNFMCENNGQNMARFLEKGPECVREKQETLGTCTKTFFTETINSVGLGLPNGGANGTTTFSWQGIELKDCKILRKYRKCVMVELANCTNPIPATIVDRVLTVTEKFTSCDKYAPCEIDLDCNSDARWSIFKKTQP